MDNINNSNELCQGQVPCMGEWNKLRGFWEKEGTFKTSLTHLDGLSGAVPYGSEEASIYGSEFKHTDINTPYYDRMTTERVIAPWEAELEEKTFMNTLKELNQRPFTTYQNIENKPIPQEKYESVEGFGSDTKNINFKIAAICFLLFIIFMIIREMK